MSKDGTYVYLQTTEVSLSPHPPAPRHFDAEATLRTIDRLLGPAGDPGVQQTAARLHALVQAMVADGRQRDDPMREIFARLGDRWSMLLLHLLRTGNFRHAMLRRLVSAVAAEGDISQRMLTLRLRALEHDGFIMRHETSTHPPGVEYGLTPLGQQLSAQVELFMQWIRQHTAEIHAARTHFEISDAADADADADSHHGDAGGTTAGPSRSGR